LIANVRDRFGQLIHEAAKFGVVGGVGFVVTMVGFNLLYYGAHLGSVTSNTIAMIVATTVTFLGNRFWAFRHRDGRGTARDSLLFAFFNIVGWAIQTAPVSLTDHVLHQTDRLSVNIALIVGVALGTMFRFWAYRRWVWSTPATPAPAATVLAGAQASPAAASPQDGDAGIRVPITARAAR
jgi:putative flippase GtrA